MSATVTPIDAEGNDVDYGRFYLVPSGLVYVARGQAYSTSQMIQGEQYTYRRKRGWVEGDRRLVSADVMIPLNIDELQSLTVTADAVRHGRDLYSRLYHDGTAGAQMRERIAARRRGMSAVRAKMQKGEE